MASIPQEVINDIKQKARIEDVIGSYIPIIKSGVNYKAYCPFHDDHDPSLSINTSKQIYRCFSCPSENHTSGDVFGFVMQYKKISYPEAIKEVADKIGYKYDFSNNRTNVFEETVFHKIIADTVSFCQNELNSSTGKPYKDYLINRHLDKDILRKYQIGYNPTNGRLYNFLHQKGYRDNDIIEANVCRLTENGIKDVFYDRIMIPIFDEYNHPIGFTARSIDKSNPSKYINSTDTPIFHKSDVLFNLNNARATIRENKTAILAEGPMDVIAFDRAGISNAVCSMGTNLTDNQLKLLKRHASKLILAYDGDKAGQSAILRAGKMALNVGFMISVINNKTDLDPDEIVNKYGADELKAMINRSMTWLDFIFVYYQGQYDLNNYSARKEFANKVASEINASSDELDKDTYLRKLSEISGFSYEVLRKEKVITTDIVPVQMPKRVKKASITGLEIAQRTILKQLMLSATNVSIFQDQLVELPDEKYQRYVSLITDSYQQEPKFKIASLSEQLDDEQYSLLLGILADKTLSETASEDLLKDCCIKLKIDKMTKEKKEISSQIEKLNDGHLKAKLSVNYINVQKEIKKLKEQLSKKTGGRDNE